MTVRMDLPKVAPGAAQAMYSLQNYVNECGLEASLLELVKTRVTLIEPPFAIDLGNQIA